MEENCHVTFLLPTPGKAQSLNKSLNNSGTKKDII